MSTKRFKMHIIVLAHSLLGCLYRDRKAPDMVEAYVIKYLFSLFGV